MKDFLIFSIPATVILLYYIGFRIYAAFKRKKEKKLTDLSLLTPRKLNRSFILEKPFSDGQWASMAELFESLGGRVIKGDGIGWVVYLGESASAQFDGMVNIPNLEMPLRIIFQKDGSQYNVRIDEDFGFQLFMGPVKSTFKEKYREAFNHYEGMILENLS